MADRFDSFLKEVDEDLRREQIRKLWEQYGLVAVGGIVALLAAVAGYTYWQGRRIATAEASGANYETASKLIRDGKPDEAARALADIAKSGAPGYQAMAQLRLAATHVKAGRNAEAVAVYEAVAKDGAIDQIFRDLASVNAANLRLDTATWAEMESRLTPLMGEKSPWRTAAREMLGLAAYKAGKLDDARKIFDQLLGDKAAPPGMSERVQLMLAILTDAEAAKAAAAPAPVAPAAEPEKSKDKSPATPPAKKK